MSSSNNNTALPQGFSIFQPALGAQLQFFPAVGTQELDDMISAHIPGPASIQEKRATVAVDFLKYTQLTGQTFKFYPVYSVGSFVESPVSDSLSSFNASPAASSWDWNHASGTASVSSRSSINSRQPRKSSASTVSRHQTADFSHLPGMKIMTRDGQDITNTASRGSKTKEQRDHAHLMRIIKACDSCRRKKIRCDPSHKKRSAASQAQPSQSSRVAKKSKSPSQPRVQQPTASPPILGDDGFLAQIPVDWDASFTFDDLEIPDFAMPFEPTEELATVGSFIPHDYDFFFDPEGYFSPQTSFSSSSSSSASPSKLASPSSQSLGDPWVSASIAPDITDTQNTLHSIAVPSFDSPGAVDAYADFNLYSPASSFSEDEHMVSIEASSERFSTKSVSQSPAQQSQSQSPAGPSQSSSGSLPDDSWFNDGSVDWTSTQQSRAVGWLDVGAHEASAFAHGGVEEFHDAQWLCAPTSEEASCVRGSLSISGRGTYESTVSSDGLFQKGLVAQNRRAQNVTHSSTISCGDSSAATEPESVLRDRTSSVERVSELHTVKSEGQASTPGHVGITPGHAGVTRGHVGVTSGHVGILEASASVRVDAAATTTEGRLSVSSVSSVPSSRSVPSSSRAVPDIGGSSSDASSGDSGVVSSSGSPVSTSSYASQGLGRVVAGDNPAIQPTVNHQTAAQSVLSPAEKPPSSDAVRTHAVGSSSSAQPPVSTALVASQEGASSASSFPHPRAGIQKPVVATKAPLSSQAILLVICLALAWAVLRTVSATSLTLSMSAWVLRTTGIASTMGFLMNPIGSTSKMCASKLRESRRDFLSGLSKCRSSPGGDEHASQLGIGRLLSI